jgi:hypothetical protein
LDSRRRGAGLCRFDAVWVSCRSQRVRRREGRYA